MAGIHRTGLGRISTHEHIAAREAASRERRDARKRDAKCTSEFDEQEYAKCEAVCEMTRDRIVNAQSEHVTSTYILRRIENRRLCLIRVWSFFLFCFCLVWFGLVWFFVHFLLCEGVHGVVYSHYRVES